MTRPALRRATSRERALLVLLPDDKFRISCTQAGPNNRFTQFFSAEISPGLYEREIAPARTFGFVNDVEKLRAAGLARGGSVENCIVLDDKGVMNGPLRFRDEFVRHKILDLLGDLAMLGRPIVGEITANRAGHALHSRFIGEILRRAVAAEDGEEMRAAEAIESFA